MRGRSLFLPFAVVLVAVAVFAMVISAESKSDETTYSASALDVDVEIAPALTGEAELKQFAPERTRSMYAAEDQATRSVGVRCICPHCSSTIANSWSDNVLHQRDSARSSYKARIGGQGVGVHAVPVPRGIGVENDDRTNCASASPSTSGLQVDVQSRTVGHAATRWHQTSPWDSSHGHRPPSLGGQS